MFTFIQEIEGVDFKGALKLLADKAGVELIPEDPKKRDERETQYALIEEATRYFFNEQEKNPDVTAYITDRGVTTQTMHTWRIGYAKDEWRALRSHLKEKGFTDAEMLRAGLIKNADQGKEPYDVFRDRIMFPIFDPSGRVVAFSGRTLKKEDNVPKYVNSPETELFQKSEILYGYDKAKQGIRHYDFSLLVEGQFDLVLSHQAGYTNAVAVSGTAFTPYHLSLLERLSSRIVLALDSDRAGVAAVKRIAGILLSHGMDVKVARMEGGKDPADIIKANPLDFKHFIGNSVHVVEFLLSVLKEGVKDDRTYKLHVREELLPIIAYMPNRIDREHFEQIIADTIDTTKDAIHFEVERILEQERSQKAIQHEVIAPTVQPNTPASSNRRDSLVIYLLALAYVIKNQYAWMSGAIDKQLTTLFGQESLDELKQNFETRINAESFGIEETIESIKEKNLIIDIEDRLTLLTQLVAQERLSVLKQEMQNAEAVGDEAARDCALQSAKEVQILRSSRIDLAGL